MARTAESSAPDVPTTSWIRALARPYLKGYRPVAAARSGALRGWWFLGLPGAAPHKTPRAGRLSPQAGFFVGYLVEEAGFDYLSPRTPECLAFAFLQPVGSEAHKRVVDAPASLLRHTHEYIRWLTHRPPRFELHTGELALLVRHASMRDWPAEGREHLSRNLFIETLAWLVRSGLVGKLATEAKAGKKPIRAVRKTPRRRPRSAPGR